MPNQIWCNTCGEIALYKCEKCGMILCLLCFNTHSCEVVIYDPELQTYFPKELS